jgi:hypothetical protein
MLLLGLRKRCGLQDRSFHGDRPNTPKAVK